LKKPKFAFNRAQKKKRLEKAIDRQARKLRAKGIEVDMERLKADYIAQHRGQFLSSDSDENDTIDVVGDESDAELYDDKAHLNQPKSTSKGNIFSIEQILCKNYS
jgi:hypothetical protein